MQLSKEEERMVKEYKQLKSEYEQNVKQETYLKMLLERQARRLNDLDAEISRAGINASTIKETTPKEKDLSKNFLESIDTTANKDGMIGVHVLKNLFEQFQSAIRNELESSCERHITHNAEHYVRVADIENILGLIKGDAK